MKYIILILSIIIFLSGCKTAYHQPLVFTSYTSLGIKLKFEMLPSNWAFQIGYHDGSIALIPVIAGLDTDLSLLGSEATGVNEDGVDAIHKDAYSVIASFEGNTKLGLSKEGLHLGKIIATGSAAKAVADGISDRFLCEKKQEVE
jgi:hypothetical protein